MSGSGISWDIYKSATRSRQITMPAPHHSVFYRPDGLPVAQPTASKHWRPKFTTAVPSKTKVRLTGEELDELFVVDVVRKVADEQLLVVGHDANVGSRPGFRSSTVAGDPFAIGAGRRGRAGDFSTAGLIRTCTTAVNMQRTQRGWLLRAEPRFYVPLDTKQVVRKRFPKPLQCHGQN